MTAPGGDWGHHPYGGVNQPYRPYDAYSAPQGWPSAGYGPPQASYPAYPSAYGPYAATRPSNTNGLAIASLTTSSVSVPAMLLGILVSIVALGSLAIGIVGIVLGIVALTQIKRTGQGGRGLAIAGIAVGAIPVLFVLLGVIIFPCHSVHPSLTRAATTRATSARRRPHPGTGCSPDPISPSTFWTAAAGNSGDHSAMAGPVTELMASTPAETLAWNPGDSGM
jgi:Domain of unknown function (DUF4190)